MTDPITAAKDAIIVLADPSNTDEAVGMDKLLDKLIAADVLRPAPKPARKGKITRLVKGKDGVTLGAVSEEVNLSGDDLL